jgi:hypothetical protein
MVREKQPTKPFNKATQTAVQQRGIIGIFETSVQVGGDTITVRGNVIDGIANIGTAFK